MTKVNINGVWKNLDKAFVNIGGAWKEVEKMFANIGGVWKEVEGLKEFGDILWQVPSYHGELDIFMDSSGNTFRVVSYKTTGGSHQLEKIGPDGNIVWTTNIPQTSNNPPVKRYGGVDTSGNIYLFTWTFSSFGVVSKYNSLGTQLWQVYSHPLSINSQGGGPTGIIDKHGNSYYRAYYSGGVYSEKRSASDGSLLHTYLTDSLVNYDSEMVFTYNRVNDKVFLAKQVFRKSIIQMYSITNGSATPTLLFSITHNSYTHGRASIRNIVVDNSNNFYISYTSLGSNDSSAPNDYVNIGNFIEKYNSTGTRIWSKPLPRPDNQLIIDLDKSTLYFTDYNDLVKVDFNGNELGRFSVESPKYLLAVSSNIVGDGIPLSIMQQPPGVYVTHYIQK